MARTNLPATLGSRAPKNGRYERYCRLRASAQPRISAYREAGWETGDERQSNCAFFGGWTDHFEVVSCRHFLFPRLDDCEHIAPSSTSLPRKTACPDESF